MSNIHVYMCTVYTHKHTGCLEIFGKLMYIYSSKIYNICTYCTCMSYIHCKTIYNYMYVLLEIKSTVSTCLLTEIVQSFLKGF